jgi:hypothetical protein
MDKKSLLVKGQRVEFTARAYGPEPELLHGRIEFVGATRVHIACDEMAGLTRIVPFSAVVGSPSCT